jgi:hypothetical protein
MNCSTSIVDCSEVCGQLAWARQHPRHPILRAPGLDGAVLSGKLAGAATQQVYFYCSVVEYDAGKFMYHLSALDYLDSLSLQNVYHLKWHQSAYGPVWKQGFQ